MTKLFSTPVGAVLVAIDMAKDRQEEVLIERPEGAVPTPANLRHVMGRDWSGLTRR